jgi:thiol-disulfide isomerase/thioredoxin
MTMQLPDGVVAVVKRDCPTCATVEPVLGQLAGALGDRLTVYSQDDPSFPAGVPAVLDDRDLEVSWHLDLTTVPTLLHIEDGQEKDRIVGWDRAQWEAFTGVSGLGPGLPAYGPGCGSRHLDPGVHEALTVRFRAGELRSRRVHLGDLEDEPEAISDRGWTDGLPVVPPTEARVLAMLAGTSRAPDEVVAVVPPNLAPATVEKVAINAVMAGCRPEYLPVVLAAVEAVCTDEFNMHGVLATTWFVGPVLVVNGPVARAIGMNSGINALGQGNRANATIGRALQLLVRNVGGGRPGGVDRATLGTPGKYSFCFAEDEAGSPWESLAVERGVAPGVSAVTAFAGFGVRAVADERSRSPESLARSLAAGLRSGNTRLVFGSDALLVISPDHGRLFREAGWSRARLRQELSELLTLPAGELFRAVGAIEEAAAPGVAGQRLPKPRDGGLLLAYAGGGAGMFSAIIDGWLSGRRGSVPVTREVVP